MRRLAKLSFCLFLGGCVASGGQPSRPRILGVAYVRIEVSDVDKARAFYSMALRAAITPMTGRTCDWCERTQSPVFSSKRFGPVELKKIDSRSRTSLLVDIALFTADVKKLRTYLKSKQVAVDKVKKCGDELCFSLLDPEKHRITFVEPAPYPPTDEMFGISRPDPSWSPIIHAGIVVRDRDAEDKFYKDILGFHVYWHGGMKEGEDNWVDMQVPDGTDWIEYMLKVPENASHKTLGVMNHIALGVPDIHAAREQLIKNGWTGTEEPKIGRDGKWQLNLYDPDETRVELMEFKPTQDPCCAPYTGPHPHP
jgi:catechol 2,3-dioxygenase-like lactoylglutathione lyase family enzyme